jgi:hypothetical protein
LENPFDGKGKNVATDYAEWDMLKAMRDRKIWREKSLKNDLCHHASEMILKICQMYSMEGSVLADAVCNLIHNHLF